MPEFILQSFIWSGVCSSLHFTRVLLVSLLKARVCLLELCVCVCVAELNVQGYVRVLGQGPLSWLYSGVQLQDKENSVRKHTPDTYMNGSDSGLTPRRFRGMYPSASPVRAHHQSVSSSSSLRTMVMQSPSWKASSSGFSPA